MKIALCLSGQPRAIEAGYQKLKAALLDHNDVDVYYHTWFDPNNLSTNSVIPGRESNQLDPQAIDKLQSLYQPKNLLVEEPKYWNRPEDAFEYPQKTFKKAHTWALEIPGSDGVERAKQYLNSTTHSMWYSIMVSNLFKERTSVDLNIHYDWVIRNRIDYAPHVRIKFEEPPEDDSTIYYQHNPDHPDGMIGDWFAMGSPNAMNVYSSLYNFLGPLVKQSNKEDGYWCNELLLKHHLKNNSIKTVGEDYQVHY